MKKWRHFALLSWYALTILISAFLVFQVQPVISKIVLPWFGGSPAVWTTCVLFFQIVLFAGYAYAFLTTRYLSPAWQGLVHIALILAALFVVPITPSAAWKPLADDDPTLTIMRLLMVNVGLPYFLLSSTAPLTQAWFSLHFDGSSPYRLYALSNVGSLAALLTYPFLVEPHLSISSQDMFWTLGFCLFSLTSGYLAVKRWRIESVTRAKKTMLNAAAAEAEPTRSRLALWLALPAFASIMLLATTNRVCQDIAVVPFLWVVPLSLYLLTFIICFDNQRWYSRRWCAIGAIASVLAVGLCREHFSKNFVLLLTAYFSALFFISMLCHGELVARKPGSRHLTAFYLMCAAGGALGGLFVVLVCPVIFSTYLEMELGLLVGVTLAVAALLANLSSNWLADRPRHQFIVGMVLLAVCVFTGTSQLSTVPHGNVMTTRNFYGVVYVDDFQKDEHSGRIRKLVNGGTQHGFQFLDDEKKNIPMSYYAPSSGVALALNHAAHKPQRVGVVGLGAGTLAAYGQPNDYFRFYEINPVVRTIAEENFTFLQDSRADVDVILGDARLSMEREVTQQFDLLILDAFSGDAVPAHLLTKEAFAVYLRHLRPAGVIAVHISNRYLNLRPVVDGLAEYYDMESTLVVNRPEPKMHVYESHWMLVTTNRKLVELTKVVKKNEAHSTRQVSLWTDQHNNLFDILNVF